MAIVKTNDQHYKNIAAAIRAAADIDTRMTPGEMAETLSVKSLHLTWAFDNAAPGSGEGIITLTRGTELSAGVYTVYLADGAGVPLSDLPALCELDITERAYAAYAIPQGCAALIAVKNGAADARFVIPPAKRMTETPAYTFGLLADLHIDGDGEDTAGTQADLSAALSVFAADGMDFVAVAGDVTEAGRRADIDAYKSIRDAQSLPVFCVRGNTDTVGDCGMLAWNEIEPNGLYFEKTFGDDVFLFVGETVDDAANPYSSYVLDWLEARLAAYIDRRVFVIGHRFVGGCGNPLGRSPEAGLLNTEGCGGRRLSELLATYRNTVYISGHSHFDFGWQAAAGDAIVAPRTADMCHCIHVPALASPRAATVDGYVDVPSVALGYEVEVFGDCIRLSGMDFTAGGRVSTAQYRLDTTRIPLADGGEDEDEEAYPYVPMTELSAFELGGFDMTTGEEKDARWDYRTVEYIPLSDNPAPTFACFGRVIYMRVFYYDADRLFLGCTRHFDNDIASDYNEVFAITPPAGSAYIRFQAQLAYEAMQFNGAYIPPEIISPRPPSVPLPAGTGFVPVDVGEMPTDPREKAKWKALDFLGRQMNTSQMKSRIDFDALSVGACQMVAGRVPALENPALVQNKYISTAQDFSPEYTGIVSGKWHTSLAHPERHRVDVYVVTDEYYYVASCELLHDGTWQTPRNIGRGIKHIELVEKSTGIVREYGRPYVDNYTVGLFVYEDAEYQIATARIFVSGGSYYFYDRGTYGDIGKVLGKVMTPEGETVGISSNYSNVRYGRLPSSYLVPPTDPQYARDGNTALGKHGYMMNSRCFIYDAGLALLAFTQAGRYDICREILDRMAHEQKADGSWNFSYDNYIGQLYEDYVRTGSVGWLIWGGCYYAEKSGDTAYTEMLDKGGRWLLSKQITAAADPRRGLLTGGVGGYDVDYVYNPAEITWCSTEHNCSCLQALYGLAKLTGDAGYTSAAAALSAALIGTLYDSVGGRFYQGIGADGVKDTAWALDCTTWAGKTALSLGRSDIASACAATCKRVFGVTGKRIVESPDKETFNMTYSLPADVTVDGFKPYADGYEDPPALVWTEGTLGSIALFRALSDTDTAEAYLSDMVTLQEAIGSTGGVIYTTETRASIPWEFHVWESAVSSAWLYLLLGEEDVLFCGARP